MIRRLIILLLIVGCGTEPEDEIKEVAWVVADSLIYWTAGIDVITIDNEDYWYSIYMEFNNGSNEGFQEWYSNTAYTHSYIFQNDTLLTGDSVRTISHFIKANIIKVYDVSIEKIIYPEEYEVFQYEYK